MLFYTPNSCYARKVRVLSRETGLDAVIEEVAVTLRDPASELLKYSPVGRVPALLTDDGRVYTETVIVCELLDAMHPDRA